MLIFLFVHFKLANYANCLCPREKEMLQHIGPGQDSGITKSLNNGKLFRYAILQLIEIYGKKRRRRGDRKGDVYLYVKEGRVGDRRGVRERLDKQESPTAAVREFTKVFEVLTGNKFLEWELKKKISKKPNKYFPLDMVS